MKYLLCSFCFKADDDTQMPNCSLTSSLFPEAEVTLQIHMLLIIFLLFLSVFIHAEILMSDTAVLVLCRCVTG